MTAEERESVFGLYCEDCGECNDREGKSPRGVSLKGYYREIKKLSEQKNYNIFEYDSDVELEPLMDRIQSYDRGGDPSQGAKLYSRFLAHSRFKKLLEWFVNQLNINNDDSDSRLVGKGDHGENGGSIRQNYEMYRKYNGFEVDCTLGRGFETNNSGRNYINRTGTSVSIYPIFDKETKKTVVALKIADKPLEEYTDPVSIESLGLFDNRFPNEKLRDFFNSFSEVVKKHKIKTENKKSMENKNTNVNELNLILYGPPGTGKTYNTVIKAVEIADGSADVNYQKNLERYRQLIRDERRVAFVTFHQSYGYEDFIEGIKPETNEQGGLTYNVEKGVFKKFCLEAKENPGQNYVFIIDEINRGNVSKIFGELITLIEPSKRTGAAEGMTCTLPYSGDEFGVPNNVYILGTMNTADRSLVQLDAALRRRFAFEEMMPEPGKLSTNVAGVDLQKLLTAINRRITALIDREHQIGHSYFMGLDGSSTIADLNAVFKKKVMPLLQEYFFDDYGQIAAVLSDKFVESKTVSEFDRTTYNKTVYELKADVDVADYIAVYGGGTESDKQ